MKERGTAEAALYLTFSFGKEVFALNVSRVREVLNPTEIIKVPGAPIFMRGIMNVRGCMVPVVDMRDKFGLPSICDADATRAIVMELSRGDRTVVIGVLADRVYEVIEMESGQIQAPSIAELRWKSEFIKGIGKHHSAKIAILDVDRVFSAEEITMMTLNHNASRSASGAGVGCARSA